MSQRLIELLNKRDQQLTIDDIINIYGTEKEQLHNIYEEEHKDHVELCKMNPSSEHQIDFINRWNELGFYNGE